MFDSKDTDMFVFKHHDKFFDPRWYEYKIYGADTKQLLFESHEEPLERKFRVRDIFGGAISQIKILDVDGKEYVRIAKRNSPTGVPFFGMGHPRYCVYNENKHILGEFKPHHFIHRFFWLNVYDYYGKRVLQVKRRPLSSKWSFFAGNAQVGHMKAKHKSIRERFRNKPDYYFLEILEPAKQNEAIIKLIFAVIVICKHGFSPIY